MILLKCASVLALIPLRATGVLTIDIPRKESVRIVSILTRSQLVASSLVIRAHVTSTLMMTILAASSFIITLLTVSILFMSPDMLSSLAGSILIMSILIESRVVTSTLKTSGELGADFVFA